MRENSLVAEVELVQFRSFVKRDSTGVSKYLLELVRELGSEGGTNQRHRAVYRR